VPAKSCGTLRRSDSRFVAIVLSVPIVLEDRETIVVLESSRVNCTVFDGSYASSRYRYLIFVHSRRRAVDVFEVRVAPRPTEPKSAAGPVMARAADCDRARRHSRRTAPAIRRRTRSCEHDHQQRLIH